MLLSYIACRTPRPILLAVGWVLGNLYYLIIEKMRRRAYNYLESHIPGSDHTTNVGLVFICFQQNPVTQFTAIQQRLNDNDRLNTWITHIGSAVFAVPPGTSEVGAGKDQYWGASLLES